MVSLDEALALNPGNKLSKAEFSALLRTTYTQSELLELAKLEQAVQNQIWTEKHLFKYKPVSDEARRFHASTASHRIVLGGNGCLPLTAPVLMADGTWLPLKDVKIGDRIIAVDKEQRGKPAKVSNVFRSGVREVFEIQFSDGGSLHATLDHRIPMYIGPGKKTSKGYEQIPYKRKLADYAHRFQQTRADKRLSAISPKEISFGRNRSLPIDPYLLGFLLGDGNLTNTALRFSATDQNVIDRVQSLIEPEFILRRDKGCNFRVTTKIRGYHRIISDLRKLKLWGCDSRTKFIPRQYLTASVWQREQLLCGLVDTDGGLNSYASVSKTLAYDFAFLVRSLGGKATITERQNNFGSFWGIYWRLNRRLPLSIPRKQIVEAKKPLDNSRRIIRSIKSLGPMETGDIEVDHPDHCYVACDWIVVSNSSKTESGLVDLVIALTGEIPVSLNGIYPADMLRAPISARLIVKSLTNTWEQSIKPKLIWSRWTGLADGKHGHYGWIPRSFLFKGSWDESWSEKFRTLTLTNGSTLQIMSHDQDVTDHASVSMHYIMIDEGVKHALWRENAMRLREGGRIIMCMTPPDDESASWDAAWVYDDLYEKGIQDSPGKDPDIESFTLFTEHNQNIAPDFIQKIGKNLTPEQREVRFHGKFMHLGGRIYTTFTEREQQWCFSCNKISFAVANIAAKGKLSCSVCGDTNLTAFSHVVEPFEAAYKWPCIFVIDPHPRKPVMMQWVAIDPADDWWMIAELSVDGTPEEVRDKVRDVEKRFDLYVGKRIMDPNMGRSQAHNAGRRHITVGEVYSNVGLRCTEADDNFHTGKDCIKTMLKPDPKTLAPRFHIFNTCRTAISQFNKFSWDEWSRFSSDVRNPKGTPKDKDNDHPVMTGYLANDNPSYAGYHQGYSIAAPKKRRVGAY